MPPNAASLYGFIIVDDYSHYTWVHIITFKTEVQDVFRRFSNRAMTNYALKIKHIRSDNGTEFKNTRLDDYLDELGITHELSRMGMQNVRTGHSSRWLALCLMNTRPLVDGGQKQLILLSHHQSGISSQIPQEDLI